MYAYLGVQSSDTELHLHRCSWVYTRTSHQLPSQLLMYCRLAVAIVASPAGLATLWPGGYWRQCLEIAGDHGQRACIGMPALCSYSCCRLVACWPARAAAGTHAAAEHAASTHPVAAPAPQLFFQAESFRDSGVFWNRDFFPKDFLIFRNIK